ncbi:MAG: glycosyltransferase family 4 protein [Candidatus Magasanikbacteria bacterium]|nr:glycosyltransferase family 4 protein [Candidatus Magasanikbacteria bacterium]
MRIAMIGQKGVPAIYGGIERHVEELSVELAKQGHDVFVYAREWFTDKKIKKYQGVNIIHTPTLRTKHLDAIVHTLTSTIHALIQKPDVIHYHGVGPALLSWIPRLFSSKIKVVVTMHCLDRYHQKWGFFARFMLRVGEWAGCTFAHQAISVSKTIQGYCLNEYRTSTTYIPNGIKTNEHQNYSLIDQWNLTPQKYILMVSRLVKHKGAHYLLEAWQIARQQNPELLKDYKLAIVGDAVFTDDYVAKLRQIARGDNSVVFTGWQKSQELAELYDNTTLLVHPSENEGLPITILQAMSYAKPVLVSDIAEHKEVVSDEDFWFSNTDVYSLAEKIAELIQKPELLKEKGKANKILVEKNYRWEDIAKQTIAIYSSINTDTLKKLQALRA